MAQNEIRYRVVYRAGNHHRTLGRIIGETPSHHTLDPFLSRLLLAGVRDGELFLVEEATRRIVVRRLVRVSRRQRRGFPRGTNDISSDPIESTSISRDEAPTEVHGRTASASPGAGNSPTNGLPAFHSGDSD